MYYTERQPPPSFSLRSIFAGEWYLKGFADAYAAHWAVTPCGSAGEAYKKGYALGLAAVRREFFEATSNSLRFSSQLADA